MRTNNRILAFKAAAKVAGLLLWGALASFGQQVNLTAGPTQTVLPDGNTVPMWGYSCGAPVAHSVATCAALNPSAGSNWSPVVITVPTGSNLIISLTNNLQFTPAGSTTPNQVPTSLVIVGQLGGGLGTPTTVASPVHPTQAPTWPITTGTPTFTPPTQNARVQSFATEVAVGTPATLSWTTPRPGTYLIESGTHPSIQGPMGLYGILVVTQAPLGGSKGTAYPAGPSATTQPAVNYDADIPLLLSEIDPVQNNAVNTAVHTANFVETKTIGPYDAGSVNFINVTNAGSGYTSAPTVMLSGGSGSGATAVATIDATAGSPTKGQVTGITVTNAGSGYNSPPTVTFSGGGGTGAAGMATLTLGTNEVAHCGPACYPPAVNYTPMYYLFNGVAFNKANAAASLFPVSAPIANPPATGGTTGQVLVRFVNAGLRMHVPSIVGAQTGASGTGGFTLIAEDGNRLPGLPRVQNEVFLAAGKTYDVMINAPPPPTSPALAKALPVYDRELSLSGNATQRDAGMLAYLSINGSGLPGASSLGNAVANADSYPSVVPGNTLTVSDPSKGVMANDVNVYGVQVKTAPTHGALTLASNGTFTYIPDATWSATSSATILDTFTYQANGTGPTAMVTLSSAPIESAGGIVVGNMTFTSTMSTYLSIKTPGVLAMAIDAAHYPLSVASPKVVVPSGSGLHLNVDKNGGFTASVPSAGMYTFTFQAQNSQGTLSAPATVTLIFPTPSNLAVNVVDGKDKSAITDYRWIIEEDRTFYVDPTKTTNTGGTTASTVVPTFGVNFAVSNMPFVAQGCTGPMSCESGQTVLGQPAVCDVGNGNCRTNASQQTAVSPSQVALDPTKRYYISVLPGDAYIPFSTGNMMANCANGASQPGAANCGHTMGGAPISFNLNGGNPVTVLAEPAPLPSGKLSVFVFEDDFPLNGEVDSGGGVDVLAPNEPGLGGFQIHLWDAMGQNGDFTGQMTYDMFNQPLTNSLAGTPDPSNHNVDACPLTVQTGGITGMIVTCPKYEADGKTLSPLAGQAVVNNLMPGRWGVVATPGADRIARGEEWLQTNTLDGQKAHDVFTRIGEPSYFQEYGPAGYHVTIGFANPAIINSRKAAVCHGGDGNVTGTGCNNTVTGRVTTERMSRTPDERLYSSGSHDSFYFSQCYVSFGDPDGEDFAFTKCAADGSFSLSGLPDGQWRVTVFDQWNDALVDGLSTPVALGGGKTTALGDVAVNQWQANLYTRTFIDDNKDGVSQSSENGIPLIPVNIRLRDGSLENNITTDFTGTANFNETFPLFSWYTVETDNTRYKTTGIHVVYDAGGPPDGTTCGGGYPACGKSKIGNFLANTAEQNSVPTNLRVPGAVYCDNADCTGFSIQNGPTSSATANLSTGRIDPPWVETEGWQGFSGQNNFMEFGKTPYVPGENGGIQGHVVYASTRPFDDPQLLVQAQWEPLVPHVTINLYQEGTAPDGSQSLTLVDTTQTSSWDDWAQGFRSDGVPNMNCPGQTTSDLFYFTLQNQPNYLNVYASAHGGPAAPTLPYSSQYKCYDGLHNFNQIQPAPYDGMYKFPSVTSLDPVTGKPTGTNCTACTTNPDTTDPYRAGTPMLKPGKYVVEVVVPPGYELVKEEDKNILIGDNFIAPVTQEFPGLGGAVFILPDQASVASASNANNAQNPTQSLGNSPLNQGVPSFPVEPVWACVGEARTVPDYISLFPQSKEVAPFAGSTRNLCDRKEVTLGDQMGTTAKFYIFTSTHIAAKFTGVITDDFTSEFDPFSPQFGEKFSPPDLPVSVKDWTGQEISRVYADQWGAYNGMQYSTWEVNPPNPTGYSPTMSILCMNDPGTGVTPDPLFNPGYSQFCYELPFMPGTTSYLDTPVVPTTAFSEGYNHPDCAYPAATPAISEVDGDGKGPWVKMPGGAGGPVASVMVTSGGSGYTSAPTVTFTGGGGTGATGTATITPTGAIAGLTLTSGGTGYTSAPTVSFTSSNGSGATATTTISGSVSSVTVSSGGSYTTSPTVSFTGGGGTGAAGNVVTSGRVASVTLGAHGSNYTSAPTVSLNGGGGSGAAATATITKGVTGIAVRSAGFGYTTAPAVTITGGGGTGATATATVTLGFVSAFTITSPGTGYTSVPTVTIAAPPPGLFHSTATAAATISGFVSSISVTNAGTGYTSAPTVAFTGGGGSGATATTALSYTVTGVTVTNGGSGYTSVPTVTFTGTGNPAASAIAAISSSVTSIALLNPGTGYTTVPSVVLTGGGGSGAAASAALANAVTAVTVTAQGSGYTAAPTVNFTGGGGTGAAATAKIATTGVLTINALGDVPVLNNGYSGPAATAAPFNQKTVTRHYGFGASQGTVSIGGVTVPPANITSWTDQQIVLSVPSGVPNCKLQQQAQYNGATAQCGQLVVTTAAGQQSIDTVTVTIGGKQPTYVSSTIQSAIDAAAPGDLIMVPAGVYNELILMWKPVRLQGVGAASTIINANTHPAGKLDPWRAEVNCLFGLALNGQPYTPAGGNNPYSNGTQSCPATGWNYFTGGPNNPQVDRLPLEGILGWDTTVNGNLAQLLQEPTLLGAYEGAGITVLSKGVNIPAGSGNVFGSGSESAFPTGSTVLTAANCGTGTPGARGYVANPYSSNFQCNPSSIDGLSVTDSSQGGGGIFVHAWAHNLEIANNRIFNNIGTLSGGISIGQGESPDAYLAGDAAGVDVPASCITGNPLLNPNQQLPYCFDLNVNVHNNYVALNTSIGDELFSGTPAGPGGVAFCTGADYYKFNYNWVCGNMSTGDGGGFAHIGFSWNGDIEHNSFLFNQSLNPTISTNGGGVVIMGAPPDGYLPGTTTECGGTVADADCTPGLSDGTGPGLVINANLIMGNAAESGSGGGLRLQDINGTEVALYPMANRLDGSLNWNSVKVTNNIITNNVAGWDGAGISLQDALAVDIVNNTIASNDTTATAGVLFNTIGAPLASAPAAGTCTTSGPNTTPVCVTTSTPQPAGLVAVQNSPQLTSSLPPNIVCPIGHAVGANLINGACRDVSYPLLYNDLFWQNRSFYIGVGALSSQYQQNIVSLYNAFSGTPAASQPSAGAVMANGSGALITGGTGACTPGASYWDIGIRGDPNQATAGFKGYRLTPIYSVLTDAADYTTYPSLLGAANTNNVGANPTVISQYCNGSRTPPENSANGGGWNVPPGISDASVPNPIFNLTPSATVDEGNNWVNMTWGPLAMTNPVTGAVLGNYAPAVGSPAIDVIPANSVPGMAAPPTDFFGNPRPAPGTPIDVGAVEYRPAPPTLISLNPTSGVQGATALVTLTGTNLSGASAITVSGGGITVNTIAVTNNGGTSVTANFVIAGNATLGTRNVTITTPGGVSAPLTFTVVAPLPPTLTSITPNAGVRGTAVPVTLVGTNLTGGTIGISGTGVTAGTITVSPDGTTLTTTFTSTDTAAIAARTVTVTTPGGTTSGVSYSLTAPPAPTLTQMLPVTAMRGTTSTVTFTGTNLMGAVVNVSGTGVSATVIGVSADGTSVTASFVITPGAATGNRTVNITTGGGTTGNLNFNITAPPLPTLASISPTSGTHGTSVTLTLTGTAFTTATSVNVSGGFLSFVNVTSFTVNNDTTITATLTLGDLSNLVASRTITVTTAGGTSNSVNFTIN